MIAAPTAIQPGGYVRRAYAERGPARTPEVVLEVAEFGGLWRIALEWECPEPVSEVRKDPGLMSDAAALLTPVVEGAPWITMGEPGRGVEGALWRADGDTLYRVTAEGLGTVVRHPADEEWAVRADWKKGRWRVDFGLRAWAPLTRSRHLAVAIWRGAEAERGGLKSVTPGWIEIDR